MLYEFSRTELLIGKEALNKLGNSKVAVFGVGGVGSFAVEALVRAGVGKLVLVDSDCVCVTNINRQIHANHKTVGKPKVEVMKERIMEINPKVEVTTYQEFFLPETGGNLIREDYDYIIDAIDTVTGKIGLVVKAKEMGIPIISSMGAGNKLDPSKFTVADIYETSVCPLAKVMRKELRKRNIHSLKVVYSTEEPVKPASPEGICISGDAGFPDKRDESPKDAANEAAGKKSVIKKRVPGSVSFVPPVVGFIAAGEVIKDLIGYNK